MKKSELRLSMIVSTFKDRLIELDEQEFIDWVEKVAFPKKTDKIVTHKTLNDCAGVSLNMIRLV